MRFYVGITDESWFRQLKGQDNNENINFWKPGAATAFKVLQEGDLFLFKLHHPNDYIVGGGFFVKYSVLPTFLAWDVFGVRNGTHTLAELYERIRKYRGRKDESELMNIGCIVLSNPFFFEENAWIPAPIDWKLNIVQGKTYSTDSEIGRHLYDCVTDRIQLNTVQNGIVQDIASAGIRYGTPQIVLPRMGQRAFRVVVGDAYQRRCAITGEKSLPVLDAAHIMSFSDNGPNTVNNGLFMRTDFHALFDKGYITVDEDYTVHVSKRLHEDFDNGKEYYDYHGKKLFVIPEKKNEQPNTEFLIWHNEHVYLG